MAEPLYKLTDVSYSYPGAIPALAGLNLVINKGDRVAVIGANGTGKSTLLTLLDALIFADSGTVHMEGNILTERAMNDAAFQKQFRHRVGFVFQNPDVQLFCPTVREDILFGPLQLDADKKDLPRRLEAIVEQMRIGHLMERSPHQLSIGEKKKVSIASVLIMEPEVLLLDEPTAGLDPQTTRDIISLLIHAHEEGKSIVIATHDLHLVEEIADVIHIFGNNRSIVRSGKPEEVLVDHDFLRENNLVHVHVHRHFQHMHHAHPH
jgi:cobalt/nickel transport system ATP-binding protein